MNYLQFLIFIKFMQHFLLI